MNLVAGGKIRRGTAEHSVVRHSIAVRATNGLGETQTSEVADVVPSGATGYDIEIVDVA